MPGFLGYPAQPDYMVQTDAFTFNMAKITRDHWIEGDEDEREKIDRDLERARKRMERDHHKMVFGNFPF